MTVFLSDKVNTMAQWDEVSYSAHSLKSLHAHNIIAINAKLLELGAVTPDPLVYLSPLIHTKSGEGGV